MLEHIPTVYYKLEKSVFFVSGDLYKKVYKKALKLKNIIHDHDRHTFSIKTKDVIYLLSNFGHKPNYEQTLYIHNHLDPYDFGYVFFEDVIQLFSQKMEYTKQMKRILESEMHLYRETFKKYCDPRGISVSTDSLGNCLRTLGQNPTDEYVENLLLEYDIDKNGVFEEAEFYRILDHVMPKHDGDQNLRDIFENFDRNNSGSISLRELGDSMLRCSEDTTEYEIYEMMEKADVNGDGEIDLEEFKSLMKKMTLVG